MSSDKSSIIERAQKLTAKGQIDKAIEEWQKLIAETPNDGNIYNTIGDLHLKASHTKEAIDAYLKAADAFRGAGFDLKSIAVFKKILKIDPSRIDVYEKLADVHAERGLVANAVEDYTRVAKHHAKQGDLHASVAVYRKLANLDPKNFAVRQKLAEVCQKWGLAKEAIEEYGKVLAIFKDQQMTTEAQQVIDEVLKLDTSLAPEVAAAAALARQEEVPPAKEEPSAQEAAIAETPTSAEKVQGPETEPSEPAPVPLALRMEQSLEAGDWPTAELLLAELREDPREAFAFLSRWVLSFIGRGALPEARSILQEAVGLAEMHSMVSESWPLIQRYLEEDPEQVSIHKLLAESFEKSGKETEAIASYSTILSLLYKQGSLTEAQTYYQEVKSHLPGISEVSQWREIFEPPVEKSIPSVQESAEAAPVPIAEEPLLPETEAISEGSDDNTGTGEAIFSDSIPSQREASQAPQPEPVAALSDSAFQSHLTEAEVYIKYGLSSKAIEQLKLLSGMAPSREEPHLQLKELYLKEGMRQEAAEACLFLADLYEKNGEEEKRSSILAELKLIDPNRHDQQDALQEIKEDAEPMEEAVALQEIPADILSAPLDELLEAGTELSDASDIQGIPAASEGEAVEEEAASPVDALRTELLEAEACLKNGDPNGAKAILWQILKADPGCAEARLMLLNIQQRVKDPDPEPAAPIETLGQEAGGEVSFEGLEQGIEESLQDLLSEEPDSNSAEEAIEPAASEEDKGEYIDLKSIFGEELKEELDLDEMLDISLTGLHDVVKDLHHEVQKDHDEQEIETHYNLGIAYKEMGLIPEAIKEFELAFQGDHRFQDASSMLASCYKENGMIEPAIEILQNALQDSRCKKDNLLALKYELAGLFDLQGLYAQSKVLYEELYLLDPDFRDVSTKRRFQPEPPADPVAPSVQEPVNPNRGKTTKKKNRISYL
ncbi:MAG: tetratricopeptide repeat protein [Nitrospirae bacterium]|nr:tetratricopeptide repeat protein [Candidatus Manganitrophaceae bacterium]